jgi:hypothetical protein
MSTHQQKERVHLRRCLPRIALDRGGRWNHTHFTDRQRLYYLRSSNREHTSVGKRDRTRFRVLEPLQSRHRPVHRSSIVYVTREQPTLFCSEKLGSILGAACGEVLDHRTQETRGLP